jgi:uncharacterized protein YigE (DUF2233 family)
MRLLHRILLSSLLALASAAGTGHAAPAGAAPVQARTLTHQGVAYEVVVIDLRRADLRVYLDDERGARIGTFGRLRAFLGRRGVELLAATNAGIFEPGFVPTGLHVERGVALRPLNLARGEGNFFTQPNGVFFIAQGGAGIAESSAFARRGAPVQEATQSGPLLLLDGKIPPGISPRSRHRKLRSGVCVIDERQVAFGISRAEVTFHQMAKMFAQALSCRSALYLDGTISGLHAPQIGRTDEDRGPFAGILGVIPRR